MGQEKNQKDSSKKNSEKRTSKIKVFVKNCLTAIRNESNNTPLAILIGVAAIIVSVVNLPPTVEVSEGINIEYLRQQEMDVDSPYMLFQDDISENNQHLMVNECATVISVTNNYDEQCGILISSNDFDYLEYYLQQIYGKRGEAKHNLL